MAGYSPAASRAAHLRAFRKGPLVTHLQSGNNHNTVLLTPRDEAMKWRQEELEETHRQYHREHK